MWWTRKNRRIAQITVYLLHVVNLDQCLVRGAVLPTRIRHLHGEGSRFTRTHLVARERKRDAPFVQTEINPRIRRRRLQVDVAVGNRVAIGAPLVRPSRVGHGIGIVLLPGDTRRNDHQREVVGILELEMALAVITHMDLERESLVTERHSS